ncbi:ABC transporter ATP-binding protein [Gorillibacterium massiliense]|uniref:ABC transporter ATP-binding protein n=1 Tax=Gorillibacterium massiliense TaxID=1280390 RepID=UPI0004B49CE5|nr:ABC transporter ATP-binding protein [Gorillibacterium massiliense]
MADESAILVKGVSKSFGKKEVLQGIDLDIPNAEIFGLLGPSGSGKTTLVKLITGIETASAGEIFVRGVKVPNLKVFNMIGYMAQSDALYQELTAKENLEFFASLYGLSGARRKQRIEETMELVNLTDALNKQVSAYSGGMKRRLSLALALIHQPGILILDEPTVGIDPILRQSIWAELDKLSQNGTTIIVTTHVMDEADRCHRLGMIREGQLIAVGSPNDLLAQTGTANIEQAFLRFGGVSV